MLLLLNTESRHFETLLPSIRATSSTLNPCNMFKLCILAVLLAAVSAAPAPGALLAAPAVVPAPIVTASSSQYVARNYNTLAAAPIVAAAPFAAAAPIAAAPVAAAAPIAPIAAAAYAPLAYSTHAVAPAYTAYSAPILL